jgi:hypothetical protein
MPVPVGYQYRSDIGTLTNTVSWIDLRTWGFDFSKVRSDGFDFRVYDVTADALIPHWRFDFDKSAGAGTIYFKASNVAHSHRLYFGFSGATDASDHAAVFTGGAGFDAASPWGDLTTATAGGGQAIRLAASTGIDDPRNYQIWRLQESPILSYSMLTAEGVNDGSYGGLREMHLAIDCNNSNRLAAPIGGLYYIWMCRRSDVVSDKLDIFRAEATSPEGPYSNFVQSYSPPGTIRIGAACCTILYNGTYYQFLGYGWDTSGSASPGLSVYVRTSTDLNTWTAPVQALSPSIWTDNGQPVTDAGNPWVIQCSDGKFWMVSEIHAASEAAATGWKIGSATADSPAGPWTAAPSTPIAITMPWNYDMANPKCFESSPGHYVVQYNGLQHTLSGSTTTNSDWGHGFMTATNRSGPWTDVPLAPVVARHYFDGSSYGFETSAFCWNEDGTDFYNIGQKFDSTSNTGKGFRLYADRRQGGLLQSKDHDAFTDAACCGKVLGSGTFTAETRSTFTAMRATQAAPILIGLMDYASMPAAGPGAPMNTQQRLMVSRWSHDFTLTTTQGPGDITVFYVDGTGTRQFWNGSIWTTSSTGRAIAADHAREVIARLDDDGVNYVVTVTYADDDTQILRASIAKTSVQAFGSGRLLMIGDYMTDAWGSSQWFRYINVRPYSASDPPITLGPAIYAGGSSVQSISYMSGGMLTMG